MQLGIQVLVDDPNKVEQIRIKGCEIFFGADKNNVFFRAIPKFLSRTDLNFVEH
jgi:hypothetical protein